MTVMLVFFICLLVSCVSGGVINDFTSRETLISQGYEKMKFKEVVNIKALASGSYLAFLVPYAKPNQNGKTVDVVEFVWQNPLGAMFVLEVLTINWPEGDHKLDFVKSSIEPMKLGHTVIYHRHDKSVEITYKEDPSTRKFKRVG